MMLTLEIENFHVLDDGGPVSIAVPEGGIQVGRRPGMDWVLPDASRYISGHHFDVGFEDGRWVLRDRSTNGTFLQGHRHRLDGPHVLAHGDRFQVGQYIVAALFDQPQGRPMTPGSLPAHRVDSPVDEPVLDDPWALAPAPAPIDVTPAADLRRGPDFASDFVAFPVHEPAPAPASAPPPPAPVAAPEDPSAFLRAFCEGAGIPPDLARNVAPEDLARALGQSMRAVAGQVMAGLQDRAAARHFTRSAERTMRGASDNNPLKFLPDAAEALDALFLRPRAGFLTGAAGFDLALGDLRRHQTALFAALQPALIGLVGDLAPERIEGEVKGGGLMGNRKARAWDEYVARWDARTASENGILDEFLRLFAEAYRKAHDGDAALP
ncbi:type VI secretion system-associated FHA domain protein TagH [Paracoccus aminovorans]|nr:type VI secretion system-associated FHA domain protein TagH [Paracoccus aminovorans]CQR83836.1 type VI secretion system protein ImpI [Paracoccus aminovorans]